MNDDIQSFAPSKNGLQTRPHVEMKYGENRNVKDLIHEERIANQTIKKNGSEFVEGNQRLMSLIATPVRLKRKIDRPECPDRDENVCCED